jgi:hypothetical protein
MTVGENASRTIRIYRSCSGNSLAVNQVAELHRNLILKKAYYFSPKHLIE